MKLTIARHEPDPEALEDLPVPFPLACLPGVAGDMAREIARVTTSQNEPLAAVSVLGIVSASLGAGLEIHTGGERVTRGNLYMLAIAESGTGKGEAFNLAARPFEEAERDQLEAFEVHTKPGLMAELNVADKRAKKLCNLAADEPDKDARRITLADYRRAEEDKADIQRQIDSAPRWKVADVTKEALAVVMQGQPGEAVASLSSEARGIFSIVRGRYGKEGGDEDFYCSAYSGDGITVDRVGRPRVTLRRPCLSILWMVQPDAARRAFEDETLTDSGLLPRFMLFDAKADPLERDAPPAPIAIAVSGAWARLVSELASAYRNREGDAARVSVTPGAVTAIGDYERENIRRRKNGGDLRDLASYVARWTENAWRLAVVLHASRHGAKADSVPLSDETARAAVNVMRWFANRQIETLAYGRRERQRKRVSALLAVLADARGEISLRDLRRTHAFDPEEVKQLASEFPASFRVTNKKGETGRGSPSLVSAG